MKKILKNREKEKLEGENLHSRKQRGFEKSTHLKKPYALEFLFRDDQRQETASSDHGWVQLEWSLLISTHYWHQHFSPEEGHQDIHFESKMQNRKKFAQSGPTKFFIVPSIRKGGCSPGLIVTHLGDIACML